MQDWEERMLDEYTELCTRIGKLEDMLAAYDLGDLDFKPSCPILLYQMQLEAMLSYKEVLEARNYIEHVW